MEQPLGKKQTSAECLPCISLHVRHFPFHLLYFILLDLRQLNYAHWAPIFISSFLKNKQNGQYHSHFTDEKTDLLSVPQPIMVELGFQTRLDCSIPQQDSQSRGTPSFTPSSQVHLVHHVHRKDSVNICGQTLVMRIMVNMGASGQRCGERGPRGPNR